MIIRILFLINVIILLSLPFKKETKLNETVKRFGKTGILIDLLFELAFIIVGFTMDFFPLIMALVFVIVVEAIDKLKLITGGPELTKLSYGLYNLKTVAIFGILLVTSKAS